MTEALSLTERICDFIAKKERTRSTDIREAFPEITNNLQALLGTALSGGYLIACAVMAPDRGGVMREIAEYRLSEASRGRSYREWKASRSAPAQRALKLPQASPRAAAALASPHETLSFHVPRIETKALAVREVKTSHQDPNPEYLEALALSALRQAAPASRKVVTTPPSQPAVEKNTGTAGLVTPTSAPFAEACSVAPTPAAERANAPAVGGNEITATWCLHSDGSMQIAKAGVSLTLAPAEALRFAQLCGLVTPYLADIRPDCDTH